jgi:Histidine kinase
MCAIGRGSNPGGLSDTPDNPLGASNMFNLLRHYAITSFFSVLAAAVLLSVFYRHLEVQETTEFAQKSNLALAEAVLESVRPDLSKYLGSVTNLGPQEISKTPPFPPPLASAIAGLTEKASIAKVRIYNNLGVVVFATDHREVGSVDTGNSGFASANKGQAVSDLVYRNTFSGFGRRMDEDNLVRTFVPVRLNPAEPIRGALATYVDLNPLVAHNEREVLAVVAGIMLILMLLYTVLFLVVMRAKKVIDAQQYTIRERTATLETLSVQLLEGEEADKLNLAVNLHEGLAQTLTAIKNRIEDGLERIPANVARDESLNTTLSALQGAIEEVQEMATDLRPSSLDELGLLPTIRWFCREFEYLHPDIRIEQQISLLEQEIPEQLKIVIYRIIEAVLKEIGKNPHKDRIRLSLQPNAKAIILAIDDIPQDSTSVVPALNRATPHPRLRFAAAQERATLSGGAFSAAFNREGGITLHASWGT